MTTYIVLARDENNKPQIVEMDYPTKKAFMHDARANGYTFDNNKVLTKKQWLRFQDNSNGHSWDWKDARKL